MKTTIKGLTIFAGLLVLSALNATPSNAQQLPTRTLTVMRQGLGDGTVDIITSNTTVTCSDTCARTLTAPWSVTLEAKAPSGTAFVRWEGDCAGTTGTTCSLLIASNRRVRAVFRQDPEVPPLPADLTADNIKQYLIDNPSVTTTAQFMRAG